MKLLSTLLFLLSTLSAQASGWIQQTDFGGTARHRTTMIALGNKIYAGLGHYNGAGINILFEDWWEFDPASGSWSQKANYLGGPCYHAAAFAIENVGYVGTGRITSNQLVKDFFKYDPITNTWMQISDFPGTGRRGAIAFAVNNYGYFGTGTGSSDMYRYNPVNDSWVIIAPLPGGSRMSAVGFAIDGYGYAGTGYRSNLGWSSSDFYKYNPALNSWTALPDVGVGALGTTTTRMEACGFSLNGKGYVLTGVNISSGDNYKDMWEFNPSTETWVQIEDFDGTARRYLSGVELNGFGYVGLGTNGTNFNDFWKFDQVLSVLNRNLQSIQLSAFPNPATDVLNIQVTWADHLPLENMMLTLTTLDGKKIASKPLKVDHNKFDISTLHAGTYIYAIEYDGKHIQSGQIIKK
ncbi:T9SS type A sorting domain-containing protein [Crocinitomicaceae bacterium]|nr:T9SS type A sorting domain-containing protein [Crocinitomicaceae bacterium]